MASIGDTTRPAFAYDEATDTWVPVGVGPHSHTPAAIGAISNSLTTTTGDLIYAASANTPARLGIGSTGQILTVSGGVPAWGAAPSSSLTISQIATGTLSGSSVSITGLSSYNDITVIVYSAQSTAAYNQFTINNVSTGSLYSHGGTAWTAAEVKQIFGNAFNTIESYYTVRNDTENAFVLRLTNCKNAGFTNFAYTAGYNNSSAVGAGQISEGIFQSAATVSSVQIKTGSSFVGGTYYVFAG